MACEKCGGTVDTSKVVEKYKIPFKCEVCGSIDFPYKAMGGIVFVWPEPIPEAQGMIYIPETIRAALFTPHVGVILSAGKGVTHRQTRKFIKSELRPGDIIWRDKDTPWRMDVPDSEGNLHTIPYMNIMDIMAVYPEGVD